LLLAKVCIGTTAFFGGWWAPGFDRLARLATDALGGHGNVSWQFAIACFGFGSIIFAAKIAGVLYAVGWVRERRGSKPSARAAEIGRVLLAPVALFNIVALGLVFVVGLPAAQGGVLGFFEVTTAGIVVGSRLFGYGYLVATALATIVVCATGLIAFGGRVVSLAPSRS
jgi:hypothetical protein